MKELLYIITLDKINGLWFIVNGFIIFIRIFVVQKEIYVSM